MYLWWFTLFTVVFRSFYLDHPDIDTYHEQFRIIWTLHTTKRFQLLICPEQRTIYIKWYLFLRTDRLATPSERPRCAQSLTDEPLEQVASHPFVQHLQHLARVRQLRGRQLDADRRGGALVARLAEDHAEVGHDLGGQAAVDRGHAAGQLADLRHRGAVRPEVLVHLGDGLQRIRQLSVLPAECEHGDDLDMFEKKKTRNSEKS